MVRTSTSPSPGAGADDSTSSKSSGRGSPTGRRFSTIWRFMVVGMRGPPGGSCSAGVVAPAVLDGELVEPGLERGVERLLHRGDGVIELLRTARPHDRRGDRGLGQRPGQGQLRRRQPGLGRERPQRLHGGELALVPVAVSYTHLTLPTSDLV